MWDLAGRDTHSPGQHKPLIVHAGMQRHAEKQHDKGEEEQANARHEALGAV
jgi:hypothetical protein